VDHTACPACGERQPGAKPAGDDRVRRCVRCGHAWSQPAARAGADDPVVLLPKRIQGAVSESGLIGRVLGGCLLEAEIGHGGMGTVYRGHHQALDVPVAVKVLSAEFARVHESARARFTREARSAAKIQHQNLVGVLSVGEEAGVHFIVMPYVDGENLEVRLERVGRLGVAEAVAIAVEICAGLQAAHDNDIVHRDIKPENILIDSQGRVKIADLGLAKSSAERIRLTESDEAMGTPHYMAPEQALSPHDVDQRADIYAVGCVLFRMLCGRVPYDADVPFNIMMKHVEEAIPDPCALVPEVPAALGAAVRQAMAKKPGQRFPSSAEFAAALKSAGDAATTLRTDGPRIAAAASTLPSSLAPSGTRPVPAWLLAGALILLVALILAWLLLR